jgi:cytochrome c oxidase subunit III
MAIISDRADKTDQVFVLSSALEDSSIAPPGTYRVFLFSLLGSIFAFFTALVIAYVWRAQRAIYWTPFILPKVLWLSTMLIAASSAGFELARHVYRKGEWRLARRVLWLTAVLAVGFLGCQVSAWRELVRQGMYLTENPHSAFFYMFTGLHAAHLAGGLIALYVVLRGRSKRREVIDVLAYYWHFLGVLWLGLFQVLRYVN